MVVLTVIVLQSHHRKGAGHNLFHHPINNCCEHDIIFCNRIQQLLSLYGMTDLLLQHVIGHLLISEND